MNVAKLKFVFAWVMFILLKSSLAGDWFEQLCQLILDTAI